MFSTTLNKSMTKKVLSKKRNVIIMIVLVIILAATTAIGFYEKTKNVDVKFSLIYSRELDYNLIKDKTKNSYGDYSIINKKTLKKMGIDIKNIKLGEDEELFYSLGFKFDRIYYNKYFPTEEWKKGPIMLDKDIHRGDDGYIYIYKMNLKDVWIFSDFL